MQLLQNNLRLTLSTQNGIYFFNPAEIVRLEARSNYTCIHFTNRKPILVAKVLADYEILLSMSGFVRTHRSHLVNREHVLYVDAKGNIIMKDASRAEISRRKKKEVLTLLKNAA
jgi:two-component system LytT family response regulator